MNPFAAYSILSKTMTEERLKEVAALITGKKIKLTRGGSDLARRALKFKQREEGSHQSHLPMLGKKRWLRVSSTWHE